MSSFYYIVHLEEGCTTATLHSPEETFTFLKNAGFVSILRYNDKKTGTAYAKMADEHCLSAAKRQLWPVFIMSAVSDEGVFVESEAFWTENYMLDEFYNPERMPHIEALIEEGK